MSRHSQPCPAISAGSRGSLMPLNDWEQNFPWCAAIEGGWLVAFPVKMCVTFSLSSSSVALLGLDIALPGHCSQRGFGHAELSLGRIILDKADPSRPELWRGHVMRGNCAERDCKSTLVHDLPSNPFKYRSGDLQLSVLSHFRTH